MNPSSSSRRRFLTTSLAAGAVPFLAGRSEAEVAAAVAAYDKSLLTPPEEKRVLISCKLGMVDDKADGETISLTDRLKLAQAAGFDGVDFDEAGKFTVAEVRQAVQESGVFVHNAINHDHWGTRLTDPAAETRAKAVKNLEHCLRVSQAAGGSAMLLVVGKASDGSEAETIDRCRQEIRKCLPLAAALGQRILFENVWNGMMYDHDKGPEQSADRFISFVDSFESPWVGMYYDLGNHWKYGQPGDWLRAFGPRAVKLDAKGFSRKTGKFTDITSADDDMPWADIRKAIAETGWTGWTTAEVGGGGLERLTTVRKQMQKAFGLV